MTFSKQWLTLYEMTGLLYKMIFHVPQQRVARENETELSLWACKLSK